MAWMAIGRAGVALSPLVASAAGDGVITKDGGEVGEATAVWVGEPSAAGDAVAVWGATVGVAGGTGAAGSWLASPSTRTSTAIKAERKLKISDPRALTMYFWR
jgi:hypothetical protein